MSDSFKAQREEFAQDGYTVVRGLFSAGEAEALRDHYMVLRKRGSYENDEVGVQSGSRDPLRRYPRMAQMHRWDEVSLRWLIDARLDQVMTALLGRSPYAVQTMIYFKPPGSRGQALHQDNFYLKAEPGTCIAAWMALDPVDQANGCLEVVPGSHRWPILCTEKADTTVSFTDVTVPLPTADPATPVPMSPGDVLFFHGALVHGSAPNTTPDRFRRALIGHYIQGEAQAVASYYHPALRMNGAELPLETAEGGGACGQWTETPTGPVALLTGTQHLTRKHE
ncbi:phytanoyl-CoA dioxygenase family protein [Kribbella sandramycini]|uniref:Ectoine hydroxylase-related dioxygenase (Phytanoyl-CoA dioxygenase family) n=1 Tax=Kribbella sandramycini TaxID=60450 RepID=A0A7Y4L6U2_9ACTN|nr:phytanoyl-CoA dioxygenase family protein [Kribbella sandramycini]MBB6571830.1 ectoine hydroxylase-related dioxygenase (phytanoyl-CoA dioxygenase family) [Kribbella sandramycini]NOL44472.1 phytanoyl-CoA dioxygenase family protein [Kribbella sandramycini]